MINLELQSTLRPLIVYSSKSNSTKPLTIVTATAGGLFLLLLLLITLVAIQRRRLARNGGRCNRSRSRDDRYAFLYYSNDFHLVLPSYDEAIQGRRPQPPPYTSGPANTTSTANTGGNTAAVEPSGTTGIGGNFLCKKLLISKSANMEILTHTVVNKAKGRISKRLFQENKARQILRKTNCSYPLTRTRTYVQCSFFRKFSLLCFLETPVLRFTLLPYY